MNPLVVLAALISGLLFGIWPLVMQRSGLDAFTQAFMLEVFALLIVLPFSLLNGVHTAQTEWWLGIKAGCIAGLGMLFFTSGLAKVAKPEAPKFILIMMLVQISVPALTQLVSNPSHLPIKIKFGLGTALLTAFLLLS